MSDMLERIREAEEVEPKLNRGDRVIVYMANNHTFPWQVGTSFPATFLWGPQGPGDTFKIMVEGQTVMLNGNSADFIAIVRGADEEEVQDREE